MMTRSWHEQQCSAQQATQSLLLDLFQQTLTWFWDYWLDILSIVEKRPGYRRLSFSYRDRFLRILCHQVTHSYSELDI